MERERSNRNRRNHCFQCPLAVRTVPWLRSRSQANELPRGNGAVGFSIERDHPMTFGRPNIHDLVDSGWIGKQQATVKEIYRMFHQRHAFMWRAEVRIRMKSLRTSA